MGDTIVSGVPKTRAEVVRKSAHAAWLAVTMDELLPALRRTAQGLGYAIGLHGSMARDVDLIAAPWTEEACSAEDLIAALLETTLATLDCGYMDEGARKPAPRPHGRVGFVIHIGWKGYLDIAVMPRSSDPVSRWLTMSDDEVIAAVRAEGDDPEALAAEVRGVTEAALREHGDDLNSRNPTSGVGKESPSADGGPTPGRPKCP